MHRQEKVEFHECPTKKVYIIKVAGARKALISKFHKVEVYKQESCSKKSFSFFF